jgi:hypothetical protein
MGAPWADTQVRPYRGLVGWCRGGSRTAPTSPALPSTFIDASHPSAKRPPQEEPRPAVQP